MELTHLDLARERFAFESRQRATRPGMSLARSGDGRAYADPAAQARWEAWSERAAEAPRRLFPILDGAAIPWDAIAPLASHALATHGASLDELAGAGGVSCLDALDILSCQPSGSHREALGDDPEAARAALERAIKQWEAPAAPEGHAVVRIEPSPALLMSMAMRFDHALGMPGYYDQMRSLFPGGAEGPTHAQRLESTLRDMAKLHEEVVGAGFYDPLDESMHAEILRQSNVELP